MFVVRNKNDLFRLLNFLAIQKQIMKTFQSINERGNEEVVTGSKPEYGDS